MWDIKIERLIKVEKDGLFYLNHVGYKAHVTTTF